jgi:fused signal recognition particle receptor
MSEKKRGFFGRLFGGKDAPDAPETPAVEAPEHTSPAAEKPDNTPTPVEMEVAPVAAMGSEPSVLSAQTGPDLSPQIAPTVPPVLPEVDISADLGADKIKPELPDAPVESSSDETATEKASEVLEPVETIEEPAEIEPDAEPSAPTVPVVATPAPALPLKKKNSWFQRLKSGLSRSSSALTDGISSIFTKRKLDAAMLEELEDILIQADLGVDTAMAITERLSDGRYDKEISNRTRFARSSQRKSRRFWHLLPSRWI